MKVSNESENCINPRNRKESSWKYSVNYDFLSCGKKLSNKDTYQFYQDDSSIICSKCENEFYNNTKISQSLT